MKTLKIIACVAAMLVGIGIAAHADTFSANSAGDVFVNAGTGTGGSFGDTNYGGKTYQYIENDGATYIESGWWQYDNSIATHYNGLYGAGNWTVTDVAFNGLTFKTSSWQQSGNIDIAFNSNASWTVGNGTTGSGITANTEPVGDEALTSWYYDNTLAPGWRAIDLGASNSDLVNAIENGTGFSLHMTTAPGVGGSGGFMCWDSERYNPSYQSYMTVTVAQNVPEPGSLLALGSGLIGMVGLVIRRKRS